MSLGKKGTGIASINVQWLDW